MKKLRHGDPRVMRLVSEERFRGYPDWPGSYVGIECCSFFFFLERYEYHAERYKFISSEN